MWPSPALPSFLIRHPASLFLVLWLSRRKNIDLQPHYVYSSLKSPLLLYHFTTTSPGMAMSISMYLSLSYHASLAAGRNTKSTCCQGQVYIAWARQVDGPSCLLQVQTCAWAGSPRAVKETPSQPEALHMRYSYISYHRIATCMSIGKIVSHLSCFFLFFVAASIL